METPSNVQSSGVFGVQAHVWNHIFNFINSMSLNCAVQLDIPDIINNHGAPMPLFDLVDALQINKAKTNAVYRLMRILIHSGFFVQEKISKNGEEKGYALAPPAFLFLKENPFNAKHFLLAHLRPESFKLWQHMSEWFKSNDSLPFETVYGHKNAWEYASKEDKANELLHNLFNEAMASDSRLVGSVLVDKCKDVFQGISTLVDVGGGTGTMAKAIAEAFPQMKCTTLDLPHVVAGLEGDKNFSFLAGDMFKAIPPADAVLLKWILHDWDDEECLQILKHCKTAITRSKEKEGKVIIIEMVVDDQKKKLDDKSVETQYFFDMQMMMATTGRERNEKEWAKLFNDAGYIDFKISPILGLRSVIELFP